VHEQITIEQFLFDRDVLPSGAGSLGNSVICDVCFNLVFTCDDLLYAVESNVKQLREIRAQVVDSVLIAASSQITDFFDDCDVGDDSNFVQVNVLENPELFISKFQV
jgi:hypothetical protein